MPVTKMIGDKGECDRFRIENFIFPRKEIFGIWKANGP